MREAQDTQARVICHSSIMKSAIASTLESNGIPCSFEDKNADVAIVVSGMISRPEPGKCIKDIEGITADQWVVLTHKEDDPVCQGLIEAGIDPCIIPEDIDGEDLIHVVRLAASGHVLSMGKFCRNSHPEDLKILAGADLSEDHWRLLGHLAEGLSNKEIAIKEDSTESAIKARLRCLLRRLGLSNRTKAAVLAARCSLTGEHARNRYNS